MKQRLLFLLPVFILIAIVVGFGLGLKNNPQILPSQLLDKPLPYFALPTLDKPSRLIKSDDLRGPMLLNIFASWCLACREEHPLLMELNRTKTVPIYGMDWRDKPEAGAAWLRLHGSPYAVAFNDAEGRAGIDMGVTGVPETFVLDKTGRVRYRHVGPITDENWQRVFKPLLASLKAEK
jgi:cytochrome c biogenesis protein CcmG, thiol:disulfide interchange protein DsbE